MRLYRNFHDGSSEVYRSRPDVLGRSARGPTRAFLDAVPSKGLEVKLQFGGKVGGGRGGRECYS